MMGRLQVICTTDQIKEAKRNVQKYMRKHKSDEDFIKNISDDYLKKMGVDITKGVDSIGTDDQGKTDGIQKQ